MLSLVLISALMTCTSPRADVDSGVDPMVAASVSAQRARERLSAGDYAVAIQLLDKSLASLPRGRGYAPVRARTLLMVVDIRELAFLEDGQLAHLYQARDALDRYLGPLDLLDEQARADAEARRGRLIAHIGKIEAERRAEATRLRARARRFVLPGATLTAFGVAGLVVMGVGVGLGVHADAKLGAYVHSPSVVTPCSLTMEGCSEQLPETQRFHGLGNAGNVSVVVGATVGGALTIAGLSLLIIGHKLNRDAAGIDVVPTVATSGAGVMFVGRF
ncbi:MAG: hypothetical protein H6713_28150 [Myxococcales bacterium]|nr:hypothetical protein [Myxococcales bacterium]